MLEGARTLGGCLTRQIDKRRWAKPELIVLVRGRPEEGVLAACKGTNAFGTVTANDRCIQSPCGDSCLDLLNS
jgi:hypothetical protein